MNPSPSIEQLNVCRVLRAWIEEWGTQNLVLALPASWRDLCTTEDFGGLQLEFCTDCTICVHIEYSAGRLNYEVPADRLWEASAV